MASPELGNAGQPDSPRPSQRMLQRVRKNGIQGHERLEHAMFGTPAEQRREARKAAEEKRHQDYMDGLTKFQFERAFVHMEEGTATAEDIKYAIRKAPDFLDVLTPEELNERTARIVAGNYTNGDVLAVANTRLLEGNPERYLAISRLYFEEREQPVMSFEPQNPSTPDAIDEAIQRNGFDVSGS